MPRQIIGKCLLLELLKSRGMSITSFSLITGISKHQLSAYINNKRIMTLQTAFIIAKTLSCHVDDLYTTLG